MKRLTSALIFSFLLLINSPTTAGASYVDSCLNETLIYAQDLPNFTPSPDDHAILNDRNGNRIFTLPQVQDHYVIWPSTVTIPVSVGEVLRYRRYENQDALRFDLLDSSSNLIQSLLYTDDSDTTLAQNGFLRFNAGEVAYEKNLLVICGGSGGGGAAQNLAPTWNQIPTQYAIAGQTIQFTVLATDPEGQALTYSAQNLPSGANFNPTSRFFSWTPSLYQNGTFNPTFTASDGVNSAVMSVLISVSVNNSGYGSGYNQGIFWQQIPTQNISAGQTVSFTLSATSGHNFPVVYSVINLPSGASFDQAQRLFSWTPQNQGFYSITFRAYDGITSADMNVGINVSGYAYNNYPYNYGYPYNYNTYNRPPVWNPIPSQTVQQGQLLQFSLSAYDPDGNSIVYSAIQIPVGSEYTNYNNTFSWRPNSNQRGTTDLLFRASDGYSSTDMRLTITVVGSYNSPVSGTGPTFLNFNPPLFASEGNLFLYTVQAVGSGRPVTYRLIDGPAGMVIGAQSGVLSWTPASSQGRSRPYGITIGASDGYTETTKSFSLTVLNADDTAPVSASPTQKTPRISKIDVEKRKNGEAIITWETDIPARSRVIYDTISLPNRRDNNYDYAFLSEENIALSRDHSVTLRDLKDGEDYYFRAVAKSGDAMTISDEDSFAAGLNGGGLALALASLLAFITSPWLTIILLLAVAYLIKKHYFDGRPDPLAEQV